MSNEQWFLKVGKYKGDWDFSVGGFIDWSQEDMDNFRAMCMVAIGVAEEQFRNNQQVLHQLKSAINPVRRNPKRAGRGK